MKNLKVFCIGCTHGFHESIKIPDGIDMIIHTGDESNYKNVYLNKEECLNFLTWFGNLNVKYKIFVAGNHSTAIYQKHITKKDIESYGIIYLEDESVEIEGLHIYGTPWTPTFFDWSFMRDRGKMERVWDAIDPFQCDILVTHGPAKGFLDTSYDRSGKMEYCGCSNLSKKIVNGTLTPFLMVHSHIHDMKGVINYGTRMYNKTTFANVSMVLDGAFDKGIIHNGIIFDIDIENKKIINIEQ